MAQKRPRSFRVAKIEIAKAVARRPRGLYRPDLRHQDRTKYARGRARHQFRQALAEERER